MLRKIKRFIKNTEEKSVSKLKNHNKETATFPKENSGMGNSNSSEGHTKLKKKDRPTKKMEFPQPTPGGNDGYPGGYQGSYQHPGETMQFPGSEHAYEQNYSYMDRGVNYGDGYRMAGNGEMQFSNTTDTGEFLVDRAKVGYGQNMWFHNTWQGDTVYQRFLLVFGELKAPEHGVGTIEVFHKNFPKQSFKTVDGVFKILVELEEGTNTITLIYKSNDGRSVPDALIVNMKPALHNDAVHMVMVMGKDSKGQFDVDPDLPNQKCDLDTSIAKLRCAAYIWQSFVAEQMYKNGFGRRTFRLQEEFIPDTMTNAGKINKMTAKINLLTSELTTAEIRMKERAQQWCPPQGFVNTVNDNQFDVASRALDANPTLFTDNVSYIASLSIDSTWDRDERVALGHAALGGGTEHRRLAVFGSHLMFGWPSCVEEIVPAFNNVTKVNTDYLSDDGNCSLEYWRAANVGIGAFLHELGHLLTMPHTPTGIMSRGFDNLNRAFNVSEPGVAGPLTLKDDHGAHFHRTDIIRLRYHPLFRLPNEPKFTQTPMNANIYFTNEGLYVVCESGITMLEWMVNDEYRYHSEYTLENLEKRRNGSLPTILETERALENPTRILVDFDIIRQALADDGSVNKWSLWVTSRGTNRAEFEDVLKLQRCSYSIVQTQRKMYFTQTLGVSQDSNGTAKIHFSSNAGRSGVTRPGLVQINIYRTTRYTMIIGLEFVLSDGSSTKMGNCQDRTNMTAFCCTSGIIPKVNVRSGYWVDALEFFSVDYSGNLITSGMVGGDGGGLSTIEPPFGYGICGVECNFGEWLNSISFFYMKN
ncbi:putative zinc metalloproteinase [Zancudomyces culisetae]|uniref:Putative zinc metalloproteinase n=1 Tax=Zancudomyces culisetae TaxID=1213189 RepID=A0A1R1PXZ6_ZANCU|nr:putative zinc metalloproteinase [Zancudomyces culisetae]|eukprot:OMH85824.1 putative zinc metalloproteinase [Zancudomyces culisetae]